MAFLKRLINRILPAGDSGKLGNPSEHFEQEDTGSGSNPNRNSYRLCVENEAELDIDIFVDDRPVAAVRVLNLSAEGIKLSFPGDVTARFSPSHTFSHCLLRLPGSSPIECGIELRNLYTASQPHLHSLGGGIIIVRDPKQRVKLQQYLASLQRRQQRLEKRELR